MPTTRTTRTTTTAPSAGPRLPEVRSITGLRIVAALWVLLFHWKFTPGPEYDGVKAFLRPLLDSGHLGVDLFYVVSGFVITLTYLDSMGRRPSAAAWGRFWWARVCRVWPAYALVVVLFGVWLLWRRSVVGPGGFIAYQETQPDLGVGSWVRQLLLVQLWTRPDFDGASFVGATWSVSAEWAAYVVFPVLVLVLFRLRRLPWWLLAAGAVALMLPAAWRSYATGEIYWDHSWVERIGTGFGSGALACLAVTRLREREGAAARAARWAPFLTWVVLAETVVVVLWAADRPYDRYTVVTVLFPLLVGLLALSDMGAGAGGTAGRGVAGWLSRPAVVLGGRISYSVYLVHVPVYEIFWTLQTENPQIAPGGPWTALLVPNLPLLALLLGWVLWRFVEEPARRRLRDLGKRAGQGRAGRRGADPVQRAAPVSG